MSSAGFRESVCALIRRYRGVVLFEFESLVIICHHRLALSPVTMDPSDVGHKDAWFSANIGAEVPRIAGRRCEHRTLTDFVNVVDPFVFGVLGRFDCVDVFGFQMFQAVSDPVDGLLDGDQHFTQHRRTPGTRDGEEVRKPRHLEP